MNESDRQEFMNDLRESLKMEAEVAEELERWTDKLLSERDPYDPVNRPSHYMKNGLESIDVIEAFVPDPYSFYMGNVVKYVLRHLDKNQLQDLKKGQWYLERMMNDWEEGKR